MLKLEKIGKTRELNVLLRSRPTLLTVPFLLALSYAIGIHVAALLLFQISPFKIGYQTTLFLPVSVAIDLPVRSGVYAGPLDFEAELSIPSHLIAPQPELPGLPIALETGLLWNMEEIKPDSTSSRHAFLSIENSLIFNEGEELFKNAVGYTPLSIFVSGELAELSIPLKLNEEQLAAISSLHAWKTAKTDGAVSEIRTTYRFRFNVKVDQNKGEICWWEPLEVHENESKNLYDRALEILKSLRFVPEPELVVLSGEIEIVLSVACQEFCHD